jgi:hypothetical protein
MVEGEGFEPLGPSHKRAAPTAFTPWREDTWDAAKLRGEGQKLELEEIAQGQRAQAYVLGQNRVLTITLVQQLLKTFEEKPQIVR